MLSLIIPAFIAGILTFLAPCTLPLVPGYLGFISGVRQEDLNDPEKVKSVRGRVFLNGLLFIIGFTAVFVTLGTIVGLLGGSLLGPYRNVLARIGGVFVILFGFFLLNVLKIPFLSATRQFKVPAFIEPGRPLSSFIFGAAFAFGWTPCVGPVLGSILTLTAASATALQGGVMLLVFSAGLAVPFLVIAALIGSAYQIINRLTTVLGVISFIGGLFIIFLGVLLVTNSYGLWLSWFYQVFDFINYDALLDYL